MLTMICVDLTLLLWLGGGELSCGNGNYYRKELRGVYLLFVLQKFLYLFCDHLVSMAIFYYCEPCLDIICLCCLVH